MSPQALVSCAVAWLVQWCSSVRVALVTLSTVARGVYP